MYKSHKYFKSKNQRNMADNENNTIFPVGEDRSNLEISSINKNGTIAEMIQTIDANFRNIAQHGGGPAGKDGKNGVDGMDGTNVEYIYCISDEMEGNKQYPITSTGDNSKEQLFNRVSQNGTHATYQNPSGTSETVWYNHAQPISKEHKTEYIMARYKTSTNWAYSDPVIWSHWGETGADGDGVEYIYMTSKSALTDEQLQNSILKIRNMDEYQQVIFNMNDFYPGSGWFAATSKTEVKNEFTRNNKPELSTSEFDSRWSNCFGFCQNGNWTDIPVGVSPIDSFEYVAVRRSNTNSEDQKVWSDFGDPVLWSNYGFPTRTFIIYCNTESDGTPTAPTVGQGWWDVENDALILDKTGCALPSGWADTNESENGKITWMCSGVFDHTGENVSWSKPIRITGEKGEQGADGSTIEFIYALSNDPSYPTAKADKKTLFDDVERLGYKEYDASTTWYDQARAISKNNPTEYVWSRTRKNSESEWEYSDAPVIWSRWGEDGTDGDGIEYIFVTTQENSSASLSLPTTLSTDDQRKLFQIDDFVPSANWFSDPEHPEKIVAHQNKAREVLGSSYTDSKWNNCFGFNNYSSWTDNPITVNVQQPYQWVSVRRSHNDANGKRVWDMFETPTLWSSYGKKSQTFMVYCNMPDDTTTPNKPADHTGTWNTANNTLNLSGVVDALTGVTAEQKANHIGVWSDTNIDVANTISWLVSGIFIEDGSNVSWSEPFRITGDKGEPGVDGSNIEFVYALSENNPSYPTSSDENKNSFFVEVENAGSTGYEYSGTRWFDNPQGISDEDSKKKEWVWSRSKATGASTWTYSPSPVLWSRWGEDGTDGDGVEYIFITKSEESYTGSDESSWENLWNFSNDTAKCIYSINDFVPTASWFNSNRQIVIDKMSADGKTFNSNDWSTMSNSLSLGWSDNPQSLSVSAKFQYVSIRRFSNGTWGAFSYPKLWSRYNASQFQTFAFTTTTPYEDISGYTPTGIVALNDPRPVNGTYHDKSIVWTDNPTIVSGNPQVWMTSALVKEDDLNNVTWSAPQKMTDSSEFQVEWSGTDISGQTLSDAIDALATSTYNFGTYLANNNYSINAAEAAWRSDVSNNLHISFSNAANNAVLMATCQFNNGTWSNWTLTRVKGEKGDDGTSLNIVGRIAYELSLSDNNYTATTARTHFNSNTPSNPNDGELCIVYPKDINAYGIYYGDSSIGGALYMWQYSSSSSSWVDYNSSSNNEGTGNSYTSPSGHLILWDGDSWQDMGNIVGEDGKTYKVLIKYANGDAGSRTFVTSTSDIATAKWIGTLTYIDGEENPDDFGANHSRWTWSLFKGQDGYGYEYIFVANNDKTNPPIVPTTSSTQDKTDGVVPSTPVQWHDNPMEPTSSNKYVWMCWRKYNGATQTWTKFTGRDGKISTDSGAVAQLWNAYSNGITSVTEYFHADGSMSPSGINSTDVSDNTYWFTNKENTGWSSGKPFLFNVEILGYSNASAQKLDPHLIATWDNGIVNLTDYYCINNNGSSAPHISNAGVPTISGSGTEGVDYWTANGSAMTISNSNRFLWNISKKEYADGRTPTWTTARVIGIFNQAVNGTNSIYADLDNEMDSFKINKNRTILKSETFTTNVKMYNGSATLPIKSCSYSGAPTGTGVSISLRSIKNNVSSAYIAGQDITGGADSIEMTISLTADTTISAEYSKISIAVIGTDNSSRIITYTLAGTTHPFIYKIRPFDTAIIVNNSTPSPAALTLNVEETTGSVVHTYTGGESNGYSFYVTLTHSNGTVDAKQLVPTVNNTYTYSTSGLSVGDRLTFTVEVDNDENIPGVDTVVDTETVYVLKQGTDGINNATISLYQRSASQPSAPNASMTYNFSTGVVTCSGVDYAPTSTSSFVGGWSRTIPSGSAQCWAVQATATSVTTTDTIATSDWSTPTQYVKDGAPGISITNVTEYFHADTSINPSDTTSFNGDPSTYTSFWKTTKSDWSSTNRYLFNKEVLTYSNSIKSILEPHFISVWADAIKDVTDYYILGTDGDNAPHMNNSTPVISGSSNEGKDYWTTDVSKTKISASYPYLWNITKKTFEGTKADEWTTPTVIGIYNEAVNGTDAIYVDLDNEMDSIQIDSDKKVLIGKTCTSNITLYEGSNTIKIASCAVSGEETLPNYTVKYKVGNTLYDSVPSAGADSVVVSFSIAKDSILSSEYIKVVFAITGKNGSIRRASYTLIGTLHAFTYSIKPSESSIIVSDNVPTPSTLNIFVIENTGISSTTYTGSSNVNGKFKLFVQKNGGTKTELTGSTYQYSTSGLSAGDKLTFTLDVDETTLDIETVYVLLQGKNGQKGDTGNGYQYYYGRWENIHTSDYGQSAPVVTNVNAYPPTITINNISLAMSSVPNGVDGDHTYEYRIERSGYGDNSASTWGSWSSPVTIAKHFSDDISTAVSTEVGTAVASATASINANIAAASNDINSLKDNFDASGYIKENIISTSTKAGIVNGYLKTDDFGTTLQANIGGVTVNVSGETKIFSDYINSEHNKITTVQASYSALNGRLEEAVTTLTSDVAAHAGQILTATSDIASINSDVTRLKYITDDEGYLLVEEPASTLCLYVDRFTQEVIDNWEDTNQAHIEDYYDAIIKDPSNNDYGLNAYYFYGIVDSIDTNLNDGPYYIWYCENANLYIVTSIINYEDLYNVSLEGTKNGNSYDLSIHPIIAYLNSDFSVYDGNTKPSEDVIVTVKKKKTLDKIYVDHASTVKAIATNDNITVNAELTNIISDPESYEVASYEYVEPFEYNSSTYYLWKSSTAFSGSGINGYLYLLTNTIDVNDLIRLSAEFSYGNIDTHPIIEYIQDDKSTVYVTQTGSVGEHWDHNIDKTNDFILKVVYTEDSEKHTTIRRRAFDDEGNPTKNIIDVRDEDKDKLITVVTELNKISQTVSDGISCTSITAAVWNEDEGKYVTAGQLFQATEEGSMIMMNANKIGIQSDHFILDESGVTMQGDLYATDMNHNITAGIIGSNATPDYEDSPADIKFFAGTSSSDLSDLDSAPFRVDEQGSLYASKGQIGALELTNSGIGIRTVGGNASIFLGQTKDEGYCLKLTDNDGFTSVISSEYVRLNGSVRNKIAYFIGGYDLLEDEETCKTFYNNMKKTYGIFSSDRSEDLDMAFSNYDILNFTSCGTVTIPDNYNFIGRKLILMSGHPLSGDISQILATEMDGYDSITSYRFDPNAIFKFANGVNCKFYEDGNETNTLKLSREAVELLGIGIGNTFRGFIVTRRFNINTTYDYGHELRCLGMFKITFTSSNSNVSPKINKYSTFNGLNGQVARISNSSFKITVPWKVSSSSLDKIVVNVISESGINYFNTGLEVDSSNQLAITVTGYTAFSSSSVIKIMAFNLGDFASLTLDSSVPPSITRKTYTYNGNEYDINTGISWRWNYSSSYANTIKVYVNSAVKRVDYSLTRGSSYFTFTPNNSNGYTTSTSSGVVTVGTVNTKSDNTSGSNNTGVLKITAHTKTNGSSDDSDVAVSVEIPLTQYYYEPTYSGGGQS